MYILGNAFVSYEGNGQANNLSIMWRELHC